MYNLKELETLTETVDTTVVEDLLCKVLNSYGNTHDNYVLEAIYILAGKQASNPEEIKLSIKSKVSRYIFDSLDLNCVDNTELCICIALDLKLEKVYSDIVKNVYSVKSKEVAALIQEVIDEEGLSLQGQK